MRAILSSKKYHHVERTVILLIMVTLMAGMLGCTLAQYTLTIHSTEGGVVTRPGEGTFDRIEETEVALVASPDDGYRFVNWTGNVDTIANVTAASTTITMKGHYSIIANFEVEIVKIRDWYGLNAIRDNLGTNYILMNDLTRTTVGYNETASDTADGGRGWDPVGTQRKRFRGSFDGQGHKIQDLFINRSDKDYVGLFGYVEDGVAKNISVVNATVAGRYYVGGLAGCSEGGNVSDSYSTGTVTGASYVGGLVGINNGGPVSNSNSTGNVAGSGDNVGGLVGRNYGESTVIDSYSTGNVTGKNYVGGLVGLNEGTVEEDSYSSGNVEGTDNVGGLVGSSTGKKAKISDAYSTGNVTGKNYVGGLVGTNHEEATVGDSYSTANVAGNSSVGGLVGRNYGESTVIDSYSTGNVTGYEGVGGLVGFIDKSTVSNSHYNYDQVLINGQNMITTGALFGEDFDQWLAEDKFLDIEKRLSKDDNDYYVINNVTDFKELLAFGQDNSLKFRLASDLDLGEEPNLYIPYMAGAFDGNGHKISNLSFNFSFASNIGLFGYLARGRTISHLGVENVLINAASRVGGLVGANWEGTVRNSASTGSVSGQTYVGGLVGYSYMEGKVEDSSSSGSVSGGTYVGGLVGDNEYAVSNSTFTGNVTGSDGSEGSYIGGLVGRNSGTGTVSKSYASSSVSGREDVGGLVGYNEGIVELSYSTGSVAGSTRVGGLVGSNLGGLVSKCYSLGNVVGGSRVGGLVGQNKKYRDKGTVNGSYSAGSVSGTEYVGGLVGWKDSTVSSSFWDRETSGTEESDGGTGKTTAEMKNFNTFNGAAWSIVSVSSLDERKTSHDWNIVNGDYPFLSWQP